MQLITRSIISMVIIGAVTFSGGMMADASKCSPCQLKKSIQEALAQSIKDAQMVALAAGGAFVRETDLDDEDDVAKGCKPCQSQTNRDEFVADINLDEANVAVCCDFCAEPGSLGCQGVNSANCSVCRQGLLKMSLAEVAATALALAQNVIDQAAQLDVIPAEVVPADALPQDAIRAPREALTDPCNTCGSPVVTTGACNISDQLKALRCCCASVAHQLARQGKDARACCKRLRHKIDNVEDLVETVIDQTAGCCSVTEGLLVSVIDQAAVNSSVAESLLVSIIDQSAACCSSSDILLISIIDLITILIDL